MKGLVIRDSGRRGEMESDSLPDGGELNGLFGVVDEESQ